MENQNVSDRLIREESRVFIRKISIENFKSIEKLELELKPGVNLLVGPNASGKTNILEAISFSLQSINRGCGENTIHAASP